MSFNDRISLLLQKGLLVPQVEVIRKLREEKDPFLRNLYCQAQESGLSLIPIKVKDLPAYIISDQCLAKEIMEFPPGTLVEPGPLKKLLFNSFSPKYVSAESGKTWRRKREQQISFFHDPETLALVQGHIKNFFLQWSAGKIFSYRNLEPLAIDLVLGSSEMAQRILQGTIKVQKFISEGSNVGEPHSLLRPSFQAPSGTLASLAQKFQIDDLPDQVTIWYLQFRNIFTYLLPITLALYLKYPRKTDLSSFIEEVLGLYGHISLVERRLNLNGKYYQLIIPLVWFQQDWGAFGSGAQKCPAQNLARFTLKTTMKILLENFDLRLLAGDLDWNWDDMPEVLDPTSYLFEIKLERSSIHSRIKN